MATSDSDDFESADEEIEFHNANVKKSSTTCQKKSQSVPTFDSDSDNDNNDYIKSTSWSDEISNLKDETAVKSIGKQNAGKHDVIPEETNLKISSDDLSKKIVSNQDDDGGNKSIKLTNRKERPQKQPKSREVKTLGAKKLATKITPNTNTDVLFSSVKKANVLDDDVAIKILQNECKSSENIWKNKDTKVLDDESVPDELKSNKKFKEVFSTDGWDDFGGTNLMKVDKEKDEKEEKSGDVKPVLDKIISKDDNITDSWGGWGNWGVSSILNTASVGVSTLTSHVTHGLSLLEESIGVPDPKELASLPENPNENKLNEEKTNPQEAQGSFGLSNWISGVSSIKNLVESTGTKVISGGLGTLESIGKKTMEVLQEGDPGLKKKRAFFMNEMNKPILSQVLREAKDKAETEQNTLEDKIQARKVHFESLFDDYQGLVHLEALEMLSKQSNIKIQQRLVALDGGDVLSLQETLEEVKELCDLGDEDDDEDDDEMEKSNGNLKDRLEKACKDLAIPISYDNLNKIWEESKHYIDTIDQPDKIISEKEIFQNAISTLAHFTAYSVECFHKTAEYLLIKEQRSTVNEADALVQLTKILSGQIGFIAKLFANCLNEINKKTESPSESSNITTIFLEATNASSYIQDAFRLLIPILQVGAI